MTFGEMIDQALTEISDSSDKARAVVKAGINRGLVRLRTKLRRRYTIDIARFDLEAGECQYQAPEDIIRGGDVWVIIDGIKTKLTMVVDDNEWDRITAQHTTGERPEYIHWVQSDIFEIYPAVDTDHDGAGYLRYQKLALPLSQDDYTTGTVTVENDSETVIGVGTGWNDDMIGRHFKLAEGNTHLAYYRVAHVVSATELELENYWNGDNVSTASYRIGEQPNLPNIYHQSLIDEGIRRFYLHRKDAKLAKEYGVNYDADEIESEADFEGLEESALIESKRSPNRYNGFDPLNQVREIQ